MPRISNLSQRATNRDFEFFKRPTKYLSDRISIFRLANCGRGERLTRRIVTKRKPRRVNSKDCASSNDFIVCSESPFIKYIFARTFEGFQWYPRCIDTAHDTCLEIVVLCAVVCNGDEVIHACYCMFTLSGYKQEDRLCKMALSGEQARSNYSQYLYQ